MGKALKLITVLITAIALGVTFIAPEEKVFQDNKYFQPAILETDYREKNVKRNGGDYSSYTSLCNFSSMAIKNYPSTEKYAVTSITHILNTLNVDETKFNSSSKLNVYFLGIGGLSNRNMSAQDAQEWMMNKTTKAYYESNNIQALTLEGTKFTKSIDNALLPDTSGTNYFLVPYGMPIIAPQDAYITNGIRTSLGAYDAVRVTDGTYIQIVVEKAGYLYQLSFGGLERWWCCLEKEDTTPEIHSTYKHSTLPSGTFKVPQYSVLGKAGLSGVPETFTLDGSNYNRKDFWDNWAIVSVTVKKSSGVVDQETIMKIRTGQGSYSQWVASSLLEYYTN